MAIKVVVADCLPELHKCAAMVAGNLNLHSGYRNATLVALLHGEPQALGAAEKWRMGWLAASLGLCHQPPIQGMLSFG